MGSKGPLRPAVEFATGQATIKGEDVILVRPRVSFPKSTGGRAFLKGYDKSISDSASSVHASASGLNGSLPLAEQGGGSLKTTSRRESQGSLQGTATFGLFCVFDGHNGVHAAQHLEEALLSTLEEKLPPGHPPAEGEEPAYTKWREELQRAIVETFCDLNEAFACKGQLAGTTVTVVVQYGWLLTVANCGDSRALLDTGSEILQLTVDHRISTHQADRRRLEALGAQIAPIDGSGSGPAITTAGYGPLRVWPGGLCLSRGIGDFDIGPPVIACPHLYQVRVPDSGARLILASDGLWDGFENMKRLCRMSRNLQCQAAPNKVIQQLQRTFGGLRDDTSLVFLDILPPGTSFSELAQRSPKRQASSTGSCFCFAPSPVETAAEAMQPPGKVEVYADLDVAAAVGLMPGESCSSQPQWCDEKFCQSICNSQVAACSAWSEACTMRSMGKNPSRQDLASYFSAVHQLRPLSDVPRSIDVHDLDISTRPKPVEDMLAASSCREGHLRGAEHGGDQGDASTRFRDHVSDQRSFARKFGHYKNHLPADNPSEEGSTTEDDSTRAGNCTDSHGETADEFARDAAIADWQTQAVEAGWTPAQRRHTDGPTNRTKTSVFLTDSAMPAPSGSGTLPTVEEEKAPSRRMGIEDVSALPQEPSQPAATEMAVRRGKNRFMRGNGSPKAPTQSSPTKSGKPPLPGKEIKS